MDAPTPAPDSPLSGAEPRSKVLPALLLFVLLLCDGFLAGGLLGGRVFARGRGFDSLGSALGGVAIGVLVGLVLAVLLVRRGSARGLLRASGGALLLLLGLIGVVAMIKREGTPEPEPAHEPRPATEAPG